MNIIGLKGKICQDATTTQGKLNPTASQISEVSLYFLFLAGRHSFRQTSIKSCRFGKIPSFLPQSKLIHIMGLYDHTSLITVARWLSR